MNPRGLIQAIKYILLNVSLNQIIAINILAQVVRNLIGVYCFKILHQRLMEQARYLMNASH
jgi:hypothetical protein